VFQGLTFEHAPMRGLEALSTRSTYRFLTREYTLVVLGRRPGLVKGTLVEDMADDYAEVIAGEIGAPVDVIGISTGGSVALEFAARRPDLLRKLVVHSSAHRLGPTGKAAQRRMRDQVGAGDWRACSATLLELVVPPRWYRSLAVGLGSRLMAAGAPSDPSDMIATIEAEDRFDCRDRLERIRAPTLVVAGSDDPFYTPELFRATAEGIPDARLVLYPGMGHPAQGPAFQRDVLAFLLE
jgi:pimeloyl-ACP methyl ester carboxylesterase